MTDYKEMLLEFIGSLTLCDHMGDVSNDINQVLELLKIKVEWYDLNDLGTELGKMGITTLCGTPLSDDEEVK